MVLIIRVFMNYIWCSMIIISFVCAIINGRIDETMSALFDGAQQSITVLLSFCGLMCFWNGILNVVQKSGLSDILNRAFAPVVKKLFPKESTESREFITMNISANLLGMGNAATPMGIKAMESMQKNNANKKKPSKAMCMFVVMNTTSFTIIPSTVLSLRAAAGSGAPQSVLFPIWFASFLSLLVALFCVRVFCRD